MFGFDKGKIGKVSTVKQFMGFVNSLFSEWGIMIQLKRSYTSNIVDGKKKNIAIKYYLLTFTDDINKYI